MVRSQTTLHFQPRFRTLRPRTDPGPQAQLPGQAKSPHTCYSSWGQDGDSDRCRCQVHAVYSCPFGASGMVQPCSAELSDSRPDVWSVGSSEEGRATLLDQGKEPRANSGHFQHTLGSRRARHPDSLSHRLSHTSNSPFPGKMASSNCTAARGIWLGV